MAILGVEAQAQRDNRRRTLAKAKIRADMGILSNKLLAPTSLSLCAQTSKWIFEGVARAKAVSPRIAKRTG
jgi:hypothetical protein